MDCDKPTHSLQTKVPPTYNFGQVRLYGIPLSVSGIAASNDPKVIASNASAKSTSIGAINTDDLGLVYIIAATPEKKAVTSGIIFGYAFEGHCYDLPKPKLMLISADPQNIPVSDCGYTGKPDYQVWIVDKLDKCLELEINQGFIEQVVLEANLPGKRSPSSYAGKLFAAHRGGKLE